MPSRLAEPIDNAQIVVFRIAFGFLLAAETAGQICTGWAEMVYVRPERTFPMPGLEWLQPLPGTGMIWMLAVMTLCGTMVMLGWRYRSSLGLYLVLWTYGFVVQTSAYNNHHYLIALLCVLMLVVPANAAASWDARRVPTLASQHCPRWCVLVLIAQIGIVYTYAAVAKLYPDWFAGRPVAVWFDLRLGHPIIGALVAAEWFRWVVVWCGIAFDALVVPMLLFRRTRWFAVVGSVGFHLFNAVCFEIGVFPFLALAFLVLFFPAEQVGRLFLRRAPAQRAAPSGPAGGRSRLLLAFLALYLLVQLLLPLRQFCYPGRSHWTEAGHRFSWLMMSRTKSGAITFLLTDPETRRHWVVHPGWQLTPLQNRWLAGHPDRIWQMAQRLAEEHRTRSGARPEVRARAMVSLNGRRHHSLVDSRVDLAAVRWRLVGFNAWIQLLPGDG